MKLDYMRRSVVTTFLFLAASQMSLLADELLGNNGERLVGQVLEERTSEVMFDSELGGKLTIPRDRIRKMQRTPSAPPLGQLTVPHHPSLITNQLSTNQVAATPSWFPLLPTAEQFDWIQLKHGEWLKGRVKSMQNHKLEFDSEEFDELTLKADAKDNITKLLRPTP